MIGAAAKILRILDRRERWQILGLIILVVATAFIEMVGVASIFPFIAVLTNPNVMTTHPLLNAGYEFFGFDHPNQYMVALGAAMLVLMVLGNTLKGWTRCRILILSHGIGAAVSRRLFAYYIGQPYSFFLQKNTAHLSSSVLDEAQMLAKDVLIPSLEIIARSFLAIAIIFLLVAVDLGLALTVAMILGVAYTLVYFIFRKRLHHYGAERQNAQRERYKIVHEAFQGIKNIKLTGHEPTYRHYYEGPSRRFASNMVLSGVIGEMPRYILEVVGFGAIMLALLYLLSTGGSLTDILPVLVLYAFAAYRLMPSLQIIYAGIAKLRFNLPIIESIAAELERAEDCHDDIALASVHPLPFHDKIELRDVCFNYGQGGNPILQHINLAIGLNNTVGIIGRTGLGKTTLVDIITGLLHPQQGDVFVDGVAINDDNRRSWQANIAYVSQHIYLCDDSVRANIAFGIPTADIDDARVREAARLACIDGFIEREMPFKYDTVIGDNGVRLSGGQRQRMALARALYLDRPVLVMDEVTSALDEATEADVMQAIGALADRKTIIIISHRPSIARQCDIIFNLEEQSVMRGAQETIVAQNA